MAEEARLEMRGHSFRRMAAAISIVFLASLLHVGSAAAQVAGSEQLLMGQGAPEGQDLTIPEDLSPEEAAKLIAQMTDAQARRQLLAILETRSTTKKRQGGGGLGVGLVRFRKSLEAYSERLRRQAALLQTGFMQFPAEISKALGKLPGQSSWTALIAQLAGLIGLGLVGYGLTAHATRQMRAELRSGSSETLAARLLNAGQRACLDIMALIAFAVLSFVTVTLFYGGGGTERNFVVTYLSGLLLMMVVVILARILLAPRSPGLRLLPLGDEAAGFFYRWLTGLSAFSIFIWLTAGLVILSGMKLPAHLVVVMLTGGATTALLIVMIFRGRGLLARAILGEEPGKLRQRIAIAAPVILLLYVLAVWLSWADAMLMRQPAGIWQAIAGVAVLVSLPSLDHWCLTFLERLFGIERLRESLAALKAKLAIALAEEISEGDARTGDSGTSPEIVEMEGRLAARIRYVAITVQTLRLVVGALVLFFVSTQLGFDITGLGTDAAQAAVVGGIVSIALTAITSVILWRFFASFIDPYMPSEREDMAEDMDSDTPQTRLETLMPLLRTTAKVVLIIFATMIALSNLGINIGPLIAGAGVIGIALGFGAQKLVQDIFSGIFFLVDDAFRVGEYIEFDQLRGEVEAITLRSLKLRHHRGAVHTVPFGELRSVTNYNRDWIIYKMEFRLHHDVDVEKVKKLVKKIGVEMMEDPEHGPNLFQPLKSQGIQRMDETAVILRAKFMCKPREQFVLRRIAFQKIKDAFRENGIEFAGRHVTVRTEARDDNNGLAAAALAEAAEDGAKPADAR